MVSARGSRRSGSRIHVILNDGAGRKRSDEPRVRRALRAEGLRPRLYVVPGPRITDTARRLARDDPALIVAAGGDGTVNAVAQALVDTRVPLGVLPLGTLNHFARDAEIPFNLAQAAKVLREGVDAPVDVGEVNDHFFLNNASLGVYPHIVRERAHLRRHFGWGKWSAMALAMASISRRYPLVHVEMDVRTQAERRTPFVFVGNNRFDLALFRMGARERLDRGELCVYVARRTGRRGVARMLARSAIGRLAEDRDFEMLVRRRLTIRSRHRSMRIALDGEVHELPPPLTFRSRPGALLVRRPMEAPP